MPKTEVKTLATHGSILIIDHEPKWVYLVRQVVADAGYAAVVSSKADRAVQLVVSEQPCLLILEQNLPGSLDGCEVVRQVRKFSGLPVIMLSADCESDAVLRGFDAGVDDFICKPFDPRILLARLRALLKRSSNRVITPQKIVCDDLVIDQATCQVTVAGTPVYLTETEYNLLLELARHRNQVLLHENLLIAVWGAKYRTEIDYLRSYVHILRRKLERDPAEPRMILSRPGVGYMLVTGRSEKPEE